MPVTGTNKTRPARSRRQYDSTSRGPAPINHAVTHYIIVSEYRIWTHNTGWRVHHSTDRPKVEPVLCIWVTRYPPWKPEAATVTGQTLLQSQLPWWPHLCSGVVAGEGSRGSNNRQVSVRVEWTNSLYATMRLSCWRWLPTVALPTPNGLLGASCKRIPKLKIPL